MSAFPDTFNPETDRHDPRTTATLFALFWLDPLIRKSCAAHLAESIRFAHQQASASWEVTLFQAYLRLNVGQVEVLRLTADEIMLVVCTPLMIPAAEGSEIYVEEPYGYRAVPVPSGACHVPPSEMPTLPSVVQEAHHAFIREAAARKRVSSFKKSFGSLIVPVEDSICSGLSQPGWQTADSLRGPEKFVGTDAAG
jgi:hypothetical protein